MKNFKRRFLSLAMAIVMVLTVALSHGTAVKAEGEKPLTFEYRGADAAARYIQVSTNILVSDVTAASFLATDNGCNIVDTGSSYSVGWYGMDAVDGKYVLTFHYNDSITINVGDKFVVEEGSIFGFNGGEVKYKLDKTYQFNYTESGWTVEVKDSTTEAPTTTKPADPQPEQTKTLTFEYKGADAAAKYIQVSTNILVSDVTAASFLATDNGCNIVDTGSSYSVGWYGMDAVDGKYVLTFHYNDSITINVGDKFVVEEGSIFGFNGGAVKYKLDKTYQFNYTESGWTVEVKDSTTEEATTEAPTTTKPADPQPGQIKTLTFEYRGADAAAKYIQVNTNILTSDVTAASFLATDNGCNIVDTGSSYSVGWYGMDAVDGKYVLTFHYNESVTINVGDKFVVEEGSIFGFNGGEVKYKLDKTYQFNYTESGWTVETKGSTTEAPTTEAPTTEEPTTEEPTTEAPTTEAPTTEAPTTEAPTTTKPEETTTVHTCKFETKVVKATASKAGKISEVCACGKVKSETVISAASKISLNKTVVTYNKKTQKVTVAVKDSTGKAIDASQYTVSGTTSAKKVGKYTVKVTFKDDKYTGTKTLTWSINPKSTKVTSVKAGKKSLTIKWKKQTTETKGYKIQVSTDKNFKKNVKTVTIKKNKTVSAKIKGLKKNKKYYVRICTYKGSNVSAWTKYKKNVKVK